jgi:hypothetical protein
VEQHLIDYTSNEQPQDKNRIASPVISVSVGMPESAQKGKRRRISAIKTSRNIFDHQKKDAA